MYCGENKLIAVVYYTGMQLRDRLLISVPVSMC